MCSEHPQFFHEHMAGNVRCSYTEAGQALVQPPMGYANVQAALTGLGFLFQQTMLMQKSWST